MTRGELLVLRLAGDLYTAPAFLMESDEIVATIKAKIKAKATYNEILSAVSELI